MIIALYKSNYPKNMEGTPKWDGLPIGYFRVPTDRITTLLKNNNSKIAGIFIFCYGLKPRIGEHLLAVFAFDGKRHLYNSTLSYSGSESEIIDKEEWSAELALHNLIREW